MTTLPRSGSTGSWSTFASGMVTTTRSPAEAASSAVAARARGPRSATRSWRVSGPRLLLRTTSYPAVTASRATVLPMCPLPMSPSVVMERQRDRWVGHSGPSELGRRPSGGQRSGHGFGGVRVVVPGRVDGAGRPSGADQHLDDREQHEHDEDRPEQPRARGVVAPQEHDDAEHAYHDPQPHRIHQRPTAGARHTGVSEGCADRLERAADRRTHGGPEPGAAGEPADQDHDQPEPEQHALTALEVGEQGVVENAAGRAEHGS